MSSSASQLHIAFVNRTNWQSPAANAVQQIKTAAALARQGARVEYILPTTRRVAPDVIRARFELKDAANLTIRALVVPSSPRYAHPIFQLRAAGALIAGRVTAAQEILLTRDPLLITLSKILRGKVVFEAHDLGDLAYRQKNPALHRRRYQRAFRCADGIITVTRAGAREVQRVCKLPEERICVAPDAAEARDYPAPRQQLTAEVPIEIAYVGSMADDHDVGTLIRAFGQLPPARPYHLCLVGGSAEQIQALRPIAAQASAGGRIDFVGHRPHHEVHRWLARADILALTLAVGDFADKYASPMKLFEYMATGRPMLVPDLPTIREVVDERAATFFVPEDPASLARQICWVTEHWDRALAKARAARALLEHTYTYDLRAQHILSFAQRLFG